MMKMDVNILKIKLFTAASKLQHCKPHFKYAAGALGFGKIFICCVISYLYNIL
jgi:hypothetical protein